MDDERIIGLYRERDENAIRLTEERYGAVLLKTAREIVGSADADECLNDALLSLWQSIPPAEPKSLRSYACKVIRNLAIKRLEYSLAQKRSQNANTPLDELEAVISDTGAEERYSDIEFRDSLEAFLKKLSREARTVFLKRYFFCDSVPEIAHDLGISESKVNSLLHRTRKRLRAFYEKGAE